MISNRKKLNPIKKYKNFRQRSSNYVNARVKYITQHEKEYDHHTSHQTNNFFHLVLLLLIAMVIILCCLKLISRL